MTSGVEWLIVYWMLRLRFEKMRRPSWTPLTVLAKLSSRRIMFAASLLTSEPEMFIAMPRSAFLSAGLSFTPSPVTPTMWPSACARLTAGRVSRRGREVKR
jgi:hypothetical protein